MKTQANSTEVAPALHEPGRVRGGTLKQRVGAAVIPRLPFTRHVFNHIRWELNALWVRFNNAVNPAYIARRSRIMSGTGLSVNVGCGPFGAPGWVNLDLADMPNLSLRYDTRRTLPLSDGSADRIRCEHFFEHLDPAEEAPAFLRSCHRALRPGGILRIIVPDAGRYLLAYASRDNAAWRELGWDLNDLPPDLGSPMGIINHVFRQGEEHRYAYDADTLIEFVRGAGFSDVRQTSFGESADPLLRDDRPNHRPYSLYVDAMK